MSLSLRRNGKYLYTPGTACHINHFILDQIQKNKNDEPAQKVSTSSIPPAYQFPYMSPTNFKSNTLSINKHEFIPLIQGYISQYILRSKILIDLTNIIISYCNEKIFYLNLDKQLIDRNKPTISIPINHTNFPYFEFDLEIWPKGENARIATFSPYEETFVDISLKQNTGRYKNQKYVFVKIYYEIYCKQIDLSWKGVQKYGACPDCTFMNNLRGKLIVPKKHIKTSTFIKQKQLNFVLIIDILGLQYNSDTVINNLEYFGMIKMNEFIKYHWLIQKQQLIRFINNKNKSILFSDNFDNDNWCLYVKYNDHNNKYYNGKPKFFVGLILFKLPWYLNALKIKWIIRCNYTQKELISNIWCSFQSPLQIPFKSNILFSTKQLLDINISIEIIEVYDTNEEIIGFNEWSDYNIC